MTGKQLEITILGTLVYFVSMFGKFPAKSRFYSKFDT